MAKYEVTVGNIGTVHEGHTSSQAWQCYGEYKARSELGVGRGGHEPVAIFRDGELLACHSPDTKPATENAADQRKETS